MEIVQSFGLTMSLQKTKYIVVDHGVTEEEKLPPALDDSSTEWVS